MDPAWDAAIQRAGYYAYRTLTNSFLQSKRLAICAHYGERLMIISNGAAPAALALDELWLRNGKLAVLSTETLQRLRDALPPGVEPGIRSILRDDASREHYHQRLSILLDSQDFDALMVIHSPSAVAPGSESARALIDTVKKHPRGKYVSLLTNWCGEFSSQEAQRLFSEAGSTHLPHSGRHNHGFYAHG